MFIHVPAEAMDDEFIYFSQVEDGVVSSGFFRGSYRGSKVITFHRHFGQLGNACGKHQLPRGPQTTR